MQFAAIQDVIHVFLEDHLRIIVREIQPTHLGQALVRVVNTHDRDLLVQSSPYHVGMFSYLLIRIIKVETGA
jgi:hypothetical protein